MWSMSCANNAWVQLYTSTCLKPFDGSGVKDPCVFYGCSYMFCCTSILWSKYLSLKKKKKRCNAI